MKDICAVFSNFVDLREQLLVGELWNDGYFMCSVVGTVNTEIIRQYIEYQICRDNPVPLNMFDINAFDAPHPAWGSFNLLTVDTKHHG